MVGVMTTTNDVVYDTPMHNLTDDRGGLLAPGVAQAVSLCLLRVDAVQLHLPLGLLRNRQLIGHDAD